MTSREGTRPLPGDKQERTPRPAFIETLKRQFREMVNALTRHHPAPEPTQRRRMEDTGRAAFRMAAGKIVRRAVRLPAAAYAATVTYLGDTLDWLNQIGRASC